MGRKLISQKIAKFVYTPPVFDTSVGGVEYIQVGHTIVMSQRYLAIEKLEWLGNHMLKYDDISIFIRLKEGSKQCNRANTNERKRTIKPHTHTHTHTPNNKREESITIKYVKPFRYISSMWQTDERTELLKNSQVLTVSTTPVYIGQELYVYIAGSSCHCWKEVYRPRRCTYSRPTSEYTSASSFITAEGSHTSNEVKNTVIHIHTQKSTMSSTVPACDVNIARLLHRFDANFNNQVTRRKRMVYRRCRQKWIVTQFACIA